MKEAMVHINAYRNACKKGLVGLVIFCVTAIAASFYGYEVGYDEGTSDTIRALSKKNDVLNF